jgi:hypothetical protein
MAATTTYRENVTQHTKETKLQVMKQKELKKIRPTKQEPGKYLPKFQPLTFQAHAFCIRTW